MKPLPGLRTAVKELSPVYFAMVMATGIVSLAAGWLGMPRIAHALFVLLAVVATQAIAVLSAILAARGARPLRLELNFLALSMWLWGGMLSLRVLNAPEAPFLTSLLPFIKGLTVFYWATGTWWIPMLVVLAAWRYVWTRFPLRYDPLYWGAVFPLAAWVAAFAGLVRSLVRGLIPRRIA